MIVLTKAQINDIKSLQDKKNRNQFGLFIAEGSKLVAELANSQLTIRDIYITEASLNYQFPKAQLVSEGQMSKMSALITCTNVLAVVQIPKPTLPDLNNEIILMLDGIQDPGNLGTIIRTADWYGIKNILCSHKCADLFAPKVVQATMGSIIRVNIFYIDLVEYLNSKANTDVYATLLSGQNIKSIGAIKKGIIIIGSEGKGISDEVLPYCKNKITIPSIGHAESLNAAVATGIVCSHLIDQ